MPMGFCFPGQDAKGGDLPPRRECAPRWLRELMAAMPQLDLVLTVGTYAQAWHLGDGGRDDACKRRCSTGGGISSAGSVRGAAAAASVLAQHRLAEAKSVVRERSVCRCCAASDGG